MAARRRYIQPLHRNPQLSKAFQQNGRAFGVEFVIPDCFDNLGLSFEK